MQLKIAQRSVLALFFLAAPMIAANDEPPHAAALIERFNREKAPVWADDDTVTFFFRGDADKV
jgi:hypothetical protein